MAETLLRAVGLTKRYGGVTAVDGLSVEVPPGRTGLVGANGAGKTTFFRLLLGLTRPTAGSVEVAGVDASVDPAGARARLGYMPEHDCLPTDQSAAEVVATLGEMSGLPRAAARPRTSEVLDLVGTRRGCASAPSWPRPWWPTPNCSCSTSPRPVSTPSGATPCSTWWPAWAVSASPC
jgi:ABC-type multidrug transport system ATPase subunit